MTEDQILQTNGIMVGTKPPGSNHPSQTLKQPTQLPSFEPKQSGTVPDNVTLSTSRTLISKDKMRLIVRKYFECAKNPKLIVDLLRNLGFSDEDSIDFIMSTEDEEKVLEIVKEDKKLRDKLDIPKLVSLQMFQVLLCYEPNDLINRLNSSSIPNKARGTSVYNAMCELIKAGKKIQSICFILMYVSVTFWDFDKIWLLYQSLNEILRYESKSNWLSELDNPLLFCMRLADFFKSIDAVLSINSKEIIKLTEDLVQFCICYITNCQQESLILDLFDKDSHGMDFLEYSFTVKQIEVFNIEYVTKVIDNLWDLGRQSKQSLNNFFRFAVFDKEIRKFDWKIFIRDYTMPMEVGEKFQLDYYLTNRSVYLKVMAEIIWPYLQVGFEFFFSMQIIWMYLGEYEAAFDNELSWMKIYTEEYPVLSVVHIYLRSAYILSLLAKSLLLSNVSRRSFYLQYFYYAILSFMILQMAIYPIFFPDNFWILSNLQMLIVISMMSYSLYLGLSLKSGGVVLRIFARMVYVVLLFGSASLLVISIVAFPIHTAYIGYTEIAPSGQQLNLFQSFYTGILTLFEFTFGAVVFVRPYVELNFTTISITVVMVFFSFFGNIMLANMLVAFLTNQFDVITATP